jgi:hypothetical protein
VTVLTLTDSPLNYERTALLLLGTGGHYFEVTNYINVVTEFISDSSKRGNELNCA